MQTSVKQGIILSPEKQAYIEKLGKQIEVMTRILQMDSGTVLSNDTKDSLRKKKEEAERLKRKLERDEFEIAIVGLEKAGKSTFANALMGKCLLPAKDERCTFTQTMIEYCGDGQSDQAVVTFYTEAEFNQSFREKLASLSINGAESFAYDSLSLELFDQKLESDSNPALRKANADQAEDIRNIIRYQDQIRRLLGCSDKVFTGNGILQGGELEKFITSVQTAYAVKEVRIQSGALSQMQNAVIYDVPGFNSPTELHKVQTKERMKSADAIIVVASGAEPSITGESLKILRESDDDGNLLSTKLFVFANKTDRSAHIQENIGVTYREWIEKWGFLSAEQRHRIIFGSALWYLEQKGEIDSDIASRGIEGRESEMPDGDGIDVIRKRMEAYNETERFGVLKQRINRLQEELLNLFDKMHDQYGNTGKSVLISPEYTKLFGELVASVPKEAHRLLDLVADDMKQAVLEKMPLSEEIRLCIEQNITVDRYQITESEIENERIKNNLVDIITETAKIDRSLRTAKFLRMYQDFSDDIITIANNFHLENTQKILDALLKAMGVSKDSPFITDLQTDLAELLVPWRGSNDTSTAETSHYYQSLIERFSRDLYEILIYEPYNVERLNKFYANLENFFSLSVFYRLPDTEGNNWDFLKITPEKQILCNMLLFHYYTNFSAALERVERDIAAIPEIDFEAVKDLRDDIGEALKAFCGDAERIIDCVKNSLKEQKGASPVRKNQIVAAVIHEITATPAPSIADQGNFTQYYGDYHTHRYNGQYTLEQMCQDFNEDVQILQNVLLNCFIRAISMEKPFIAREKKSIEDIQAFLETEAFRDFLNNNLRKIKYAETAQLDKAEREQRLNEGIAREVDSILDTLKGEEET